MWVTFRRPYTRSPLQSPSPGTLGLTPRQLLVPGPSPKAGARQPCPTPSLETGREELRGRKCGNSPGGRSRPSLVTRFLRDRAPRPGLGRVLRLGRGTWARDPSGARVVQNMPGLRASSDHPQQAMVQPAIPEAGSLGTIPFAQRRGTQPRAGPGRRGNAPESALRWGAGRSPESPPPLAPK